MTVHQIQAAVATAISSLKKERPTLEFDSVHERSTAHHLAVHFEPVFDGWNVDCEYDRDGQIQKVLTGIADCDHRKATDQILPDIIVHHRQGQGQNNNLLVVELKKQAETDRCDEQKLKLLTAPDGHYRYQFGLYININNGRFDCTWYQGGSRRPE